MNTDVITTCRVFRLTDISEKEALVLRTLLNLSENEITEVLKSDSAYWDGEMNITEAVSIGKELCLKIMKIIDYE